MTGPDGRPCWGYQYRPAPVDSPEPPPSATSIAPSHTGEVYEMCPPATQSASDSAAATAIREWHDVPLPVPKPYIAPGWGITGKLVYLETRGQLTLEFSKPTAVGTLTIHATGEYVVDWGDGETSWPYSIEGKPWPGGQIIHDYIWAGTYDIVVRERWTANWEIGPWSGQLTELQTTGRIDDFPLRQIQAVVGAVKQPG
ncbi:MAG: hypothetical protein ACRD12_22355 [Acidimicrobiales bacterium]